MAQGSLDRKLRIDILLPWLIPDRAIEKAIASNRTTSASQYARSGSA
jgi:hypothetical protein